MIRLLEASEMNVAADVAGRFWVEFASKCHPESFGEFDKKHFQETWQNMMESGRAFVLGAFIEEELVGGIGGILGKHMYDGKVVCCESFWVADPKHPGVGLQLFGAFMEFAKERSERQVVGAHVESSERLERFYERHGFELTETSFTRG